MLIRIALRTTVPPGHGRKLHAPILTLPSPVDASGISILTSRPIESAGIGNTDSDGDASIGRAARALMQESLNRSRVEVSASGPVVAASNHEDQHNIIFLGTRKTLIAGSPTQPKVPSGRSESPTARYPSQQPRIPKSRALVRGTQNEPGISRLRGWTC